MDLVAEGVVRGEHLARDLGVARLIRPDQAKLIAAEDGHQTVQKNEAGDGQQQSKFTHDGARRNLPGQPLQGSSEAGRTRAGEGGL